MQKTLKIIFTLGLFLLTNSKAAEIETISERMKFLEKEIEEITSGPKNPNCPTNEANSPTLKNCLEAICPKKQNTLTYQQELDKMTAMTVENISHHKDQVENKIFTWMTNKLSASIIELKKLDQLIAEKKTNLKPEYQFFYNLILIIASFENVVLEKTSKDLEINSLETKKKLSFLPPLDRDWPVIAFKHFYKLPEMKFISEELQNNSVTSILKKLHPGLNISKALNLEVKEFKKNLQLIHHHLVIELKLPAAMLESFYSKKTIEMIEKEEALDEKTMEKFLETSYNTKMMANLITHPQQFPWINQRKNENLNNIIQSAGIQKKTKQLINSLGNKNFLNEIVNSIYNKCFTHYALNMESLPNENELLKTKNMPFEVLLKVKTHFTSKLSSSTAKILNTTLDSAEVFFPRTKNQYQNSFLHELENEIKEDQNLMTYLNDDTINPLEINQYILLNTVNFLKNDWDPSNYINEEFDLCEEYQFKILDDRAIIENPIFWVSSLSLKNETIGRSVIAHEIGHLIDFALKKNTPSLESSQKLANIHSCLSTLHPNQNQKEKNKYDSEDFADMVSSLSILENNLGCGISSPENKLELINSDPEDEHASEFFRILHAEVLQHKKLPAICVDALKALNLKNNFQACF